ncbi:hypothetical protein [Streptomyces fragilis]|uniref:hypothetical protein n=1 Tax=Streptomyces fragilis TaxID=67301 RepID=UPI0024DE0CA8|nr:hypothetical protein [Streptomyces fragilis]
MCIRDRYSGASQYFEPVSYTHLMCIRDSYSPGRSTRYDLQVYYDGKWYSGASQYFELSSTGKVTVNLGAAGEAGIKARVRSNYINSSSGDNVNSTTYGSWKYLYFTN